jgi:hypothetical protein
LGEEEEGKLSDTTQVEYNKVTIRVF